MEITERWLNKQGTCEAGVEAFLSQKERNGKKVIYEKDTGIRGGDYKMKKENPVMEYLRAQARGSENAKTQYDIAAGTGLKTRFVRIEIRRLRIEEEVLIVSTPHAPNSGYYLPVFPQDNGRVEDYLRRLRSKALHELQNLRPQRRAFRKQVPEQLELIAA